MGFEAYRHTWNNSDLAEIRFSTTMHDPKTLDTAKRIVYYDKNAAEAIDRCKEAIKNLEEYRQELAQRYAMLETMLFSDRLELIRYRAWKGAVTYHVNIIRTYEDKTEVEILKESFSGKERKKAFERFEALKKQRPGIKTVIDVEKRKWEK